MNLFSIISFLLAFGVFFGAALTSTKNPMAYLDGHAALIVFGGTVAVAAIAFQLDRIGAMFKVFFNRVIQGRKTNYVHTINELLEVGDFYRVNVPDLDRRVASIKDHFIRDAMELVLEGIYSEEDLRHILETRIHTTFSRYNEDARKFRSLGKYPPAMGLMGAVLGMISLLQGLADPEASKTVGVSMGIAMVATLYGIAFANLIVLPIAENLSEGAKEMHFKNKIVLEGIILIYKKTNPVMLAEELNSFLLPKERIDWKSARAKS